MLKKSLSIAIFLFSITWSFSQVQFIDSEASEVEFEVRNFKIFEVDGTFSGLQGTIRFDSVNLDKSSFLVCIDPSTVNTGNKKRDEHLRSEEFFDVEKFSKICFTSESFRKENNGYVVAGTLGIRDITKDIEIPFTFKNNLFVGEFEINRKDFEVGKDFSTFTAGDKIEVELSCKVR